MLKMLLTGIAALFLATGTAHAGQRVVRQVTIPTGLLPPPQYDKPYDGELEVQFFSNAADVGQACKGAGEGVGCTYPSADHKHCRIFLVTEDVMKREGKNYAFALRHELAHCSGWTHPKTTEGRHFNLGETWAKAEGGKWIAVKTRMPIPTLPVLTRILPASPPVVCVTPDWQKEPCESRKAAAVEAETDRRIKQSPNTETYEGLWRWCREHPNTVATECKEL